MSNYLTVEKDGYTISNDPSKIEVETVHAYLSTQSYWAQHIPFSVVKTSIENSFCFGLFFEGKQVGFARLITDKATFAYLADVFILPGHRGKGLSKWLLQHMQALPELQGLRRWLLGTKDAHGLYEQLGWTHFTDEQTKRFMQLYNPEVYKAV
jgi:GNAT superfamily N-acetyltransferase